MRQEASKRGHSPHAEAPEEREAPWDRVDEASWESFPASDPPSGWAGRDRPLPTKEMHTSAAPTMHEVQLSTEEEALRKQCETDAARRWPGARVLVQQGGDGFCAAAFLPEDGIDPDVSAERSAASDSARDALVQLRDALRGAS